MSAPYRNFWAILGVTAAIVVIANATGGSKSTTRSSTSNSSTGGATAKVTNVAAASRSTPITNSPDTVTPQTSVIANVDTPTGASNPTTMKSFDDQMHAAFNSAVDQVILSASQSGVESSSETVSSPGGLPALETKEIGNSPLVSSEGGIQNQQIPSSQDVIATGVTTTNVNLREGPGPRYLLVSMLSVGAEVMVLGTEAGWLHVRVPSTGMEGYLNSRYVSLK